MGMKLTSERLGVLNEMNPDQEYEDMLAEQGFFRSHHSFLLNLNHITKYLKSDDYALMSNGKHVEVSKRRKDEFVQRITHL